MRKNLKAFYSIKHLFTLTVVIVIFIMFLMSKENEEKNKEIEKISIELKTKGICTDGNKFISCNE